MTPTVDFYFDFGSPAAYLAWTQLPKMCADTGAQLVWKPMLLGGVASLAPPRSLSPTRCSGGQHRLDFVCEALANQPEETA